MDIFASSPKITREYESSDGITFSSIEEFVEQLQEGCDNDLSEDEIEEAGLDPEWDSTFCNSSHLCDSCNEKLSEAMEKLEEHKKEFEKVSRERFNVAADEFVRRALELELTDNSAELRELLEENYFHRGEISQTIMGHIYEEDQDGNDVTALANEEIEHLVKMLQISHHRHNNTDYDDLLRGGISREDARELIRED